MPLEQKTLSTCLRLILRPVISFCIKHSVKIQDLVECAKQVYVDLANEEITKRKQRVTDSRISVITGLQRRDILRLQETSQETSNSKNLISRVIALWQTDKKFTTAKGKPRVLSSGFEGCEFNDLVRKISKDLNPATVLFELERTQSIERTKQGIQLAMRSYIPKGDPEALFKLYADDSQDLLCCIENNTFKDLDLPEHHLRTEYDRIRPAALTEIKSWILREGHALHLRAREFLSRFDQDLNPDEAFKGKGVRVSLGSFSHISDEGSHEKGE